MLLGKAALLSILIAALTGATAEPAFGGSRAEDDGAAGRPTAAAEPEPAAARATLERHRAPETTPTPPAATRAPFRGNAKFVNNIATTNQGYDYKPVSLSSRQPSRRPMTPETPKRKTPSQRTLSLSRTQPENDTSQSSPGEQRENRSSSLVRPYDTRPGRTQPENNTSQSSPGEQREHRSSSLLRPYDTRPGRTQPDTQNDPSQSSPGEQREHRSSSLLRPYDTRPGRTQPENDTSQSSPGEQREHRSSSLVRPYDTRPGRTQPDTQSDTSQSSPGERREHRSSSPVIAYDTQPGRSTTSRPVRTRGTTESRKEEESTTRYSSIRRPYDRVIGNNERQVAPDETVTQSTKQRTYDKSISLNDRRPSETPPVETSNSDSDGDSLRLSRESTRNSEMIVRTIDDPASPTVSKQQKLRILVRSDAKKSTKKNKYSELVRAPTSERVDGESSTRDTSEEPEVGGSTEATAVGRLNKLTFFRNGEEIKGEDLARKRVTRLQNPIDSNSEKAVESLEPASANGGNDKTNSSADDGDEDKKTLSQQVADGKYGLIHTELFSVKPTRPGIINYEINPEVPKDNVNNLGGLNAEEIWLAENHLLVLSGGGFSDQNSRTRWTPIDNYQAPRRQVKIPERPKVPPPFPVQLTDDGPIEFLKDENGTEHRPPFFPPDFDPLAFPPPFPPNGSFDGGFPPPFPVPPGFFPGNITPGAYPPFPPPYPFPPSLQNDSRPLPLPPRLPPKLPFLPPPGNGTEFDEDDPALYYPPPYDFYYPKDNHSIVPPGPLVPGIVLPPPPDFFAPLNEKPKNKTKTKSKARPRPSNTYLPPPPLKKVPQIFRTTTSTTTSTIATTTAKPIVHNDVTTPEYYYVQTTSPKPIADDITNEITQTTVSNPKYSLPIEENDWMPIPAPVPSYITGPKKPVKAGIVYTFTHTTPPASKPIFHGYTYEKPKIPFKTPDLDLYYKSQQNIKYDDQQSFTPSNFSNQINNELNLVYPVDNDPPKDPSYVTSTGSPSPLYDSLQFKHNFKDYFGGTHLKGSKGFLQSTTDTPFKSYSTTLRPYGKPKALEATYYFYEEPKESSDEYTDGKHTHTKATRKPHHAFYPTPGNAFHSSTPRPIYHHAQSDYNSVTSTTTPAPEKYYYVADLSDPEKFNSEEKYKPSIFDETLKKPLKSEVGSRPIVEFSYSAPSYSGDSGAGHLSDYFNSKPFFDSPKFVVTPKPDNVVYVRPARPTQSPLDDYYSTTKPPRVFKSSNRTVTTQQTPWYGLTKEQIATENPYYAFFTHQDDGLIDDITKTYFTIFGQKIKATPSPDIDAPRKHPRPHQPKSGAPAPPLLFNGAIYSSPKPNYIELPYQPVSHRPEHTTSNYATSSEDYGENFPNRYTTTRPPQIAFPTFSSPHENVQFTTPKPFYHGSYGSGNKLVPIQYSTPQPSGDSSNHHFNQRPIKIRPPVLYNDELVNYKRPLPPINPDAEFIAPRPFRNNKFKGRPRLPSGTSSIISYRLPGNGGGHFYFLTPQEVRNFDPIEPLAGENGETEDKGYFKRETHRALDVERGGKETKVQPVEVK